MDSNVIKKYADVLVKYCVNVQKDDLVIIRATSNEATPIVKEVYKIVLELGANPIVKVAVDGLNEIYFKYANDKQLEYIDPMTELEYKKADKMISIGAPKNLKEMARANHNKMAKRSKATKDLSNLLLKRSQEGTLSWVIADYPTNALAQEASMSLDGYSEFLINSCHLNVEDPVKKWEEIGKTQQKFVDYLNKDKSTIRLVGEKTDITFSIKGRKWINCCGLNNFPDGEIFTSPVEDSANGTVFFDFPQIYRGVEAKNILLTFDNGKVTSIKADHNEEYVKKMLNMDEGSSFVGEVAIGTNDMIQDITGNILFDEKIGGSIHIALGASYPETGGKNESGLHWDMIKNMKNGGKIYIDDELIYENGKFII